MNFRTHVETQYRGGWTIHHDWHTSEERPGPDGFDRVAVRGERRIEQGARSYVQLLDALDRIDGRKVTTDFIGGLQLGKTAQEASVPIPFGPDGEPLPDASGAPAAPEPAPAPVAKSASLQPSLFGDLDDF